MSRSLQRAIAVLALSTLALASGAARVSAQSAAEAAIAEAEELVGRVWFEGLPVERAAALGDEAGGHLAAILLDPERRPDHANALLALGACACGPAYEAIAGYHLAAAAEVGELPTPLYRAWQNVPAAMGLLARRDDRAIAWLEARAERAIPPGRARHRHHDEARIAQLQREAALNGLGMSGRDAADRALARVEARARSDGDARLGERAAEARRECGRVAASRGAR